MTDILRCTSCGGTVRYVVERGGGACVFCGATTLEVHHPDTPPESPSGYVPPTVDLATAVDRFRQWASSSFWYPKALRDAEVELAPLWLPAYRIAARLTVHYAGLVRAATRSGKRPVSGTVAYADEVYVPASGALTEGEVAALEPFDASAAVPPTERPTGAEWAEETPQRSRRFARARGRARMTDRAAAYVAHTEGLSTCNVSPTFHDEDVGLFAVPVYVGTFRYKDRPRRLLVNAQTGEIVGKAPLDMLKIALTVLAVLAALALATLYFAR
ncbi:MAG: hypothetical protein D6705_16685 [Deltaproteobacteria bacterium]|nr:MAG: hypothetical protein D6705_16685 [Deltaproteobacteria bacterium]